MILLALLLPLALGMALVSSSTPSDIADDIPTDVDEFTDFVQEVRDDFNSIRGTNGGDGLIGTPEPDWINGYGGDDHIEGRADNDVLIGGAGDDVIDGGIGNDIIAAGFGRDLVSGGVGDDIIDGGKGYDTIWGEDGADIIGGDAGNDRIFGGTGDDILMGNRGNDYVYGGLDHDVLFGGDGQDTLLGGTGRDILYGGPIDLFGVNLGEQDNTDAILQGFIELSVTNPAIFQTSSPDEILADPVFAGLGITTTTPGFGDDDRDYLDGGENSDVLILESGDFAEGGGGADLFAIGADTNPLVANIGDYNDAEDIILVHYAFNGGVIPTLAVSNDGAVSTITADGNEIAHVRDPSATVTLGDIALINHNDIISAGLTRIGSPI